MASRGVEAEAECREFLTQPGHIRREQVISEEEVTVRHSKSVRHRKAQGVIGIGRCGPKRDEEARYVVKERTLNLNSPASDRRCWQSQGQATRPCFVGHRQKVSEFVGIGLQDVGIHDLAASTTMRNNEDLY